MKSAACKHGIKERVAKSGRRAEERRRLARKAADSRLGALHFPAQFRRTEKRKYTRVVMTVILHAMTTAHDFFHEVRIDRRALADTEKTCACVVAVQNIENLRCHDRVRPIIERQTDFIPPDGGD